MRIRNTAFKDLTKVLAAHDPVGGVVGTRVGGGQAPLQPHNTTTGTKGRIQL